MRFLRRSRMRSSRGHVRLEQGLPWEQWAIGAAGVLAVFAVAVVVITQAIVPLFEDDEVDISNRTWLEFAWTIEAPNPDAVRQLGERLQEHDIDRVYLEVAAWRSDGTLLEGEHAADFVNMLRDVYPELSILAWLRMSGEEIAEDERQAAVVALARKTVREWGIDGVQLNGRAVYSGSETYIVLIRALREAIGDAALLSVTMPPDRVPADPDVPLGTTGDPALTWSLSYKQRVGLLDLDEAVVMAHASGLTDADDYRTWVAYQVANYAETLGELEAPPEIIIAVPTYDAGPEHDPAVESVTAAVRGIKTGLEQAGKYRELVRGVGLYEYKTTDSREWALYAEHWLGKSPD